MDRQTLGISIICLSSIILVCAWDVPYLLIGGLVGFGYGVYLFFTNNKNLT
jgi:hypothetical protein